MSDINITCLTGRLARDAELRQTASGMDVASFCVAVNERVKDNGTGEWTDRPNWIACTMFGARAEALSRFLTKGSKVAVSGRLHYSSWEDGQTGQKRSKVEVVVDEIEFLSARDGEAPPQQRPAAPSQATAYDDSDIPF